jgi:signal peptidase
MVQSSGFIEHLRTIRHNEVAKLIMLAVLVISMSYGGWAALRLALATEHPVLVVVSGSMVPTLNVGDIIFIKGVPADKIDVGTIIVFHSPREYDTLVVHRVVQKIDKSGTVYFKTRGDFNRYTDDWLVPNDSVVGAFSTRMPYVGVAVMKLREPAGTAFIIVLIILLIGYEAYNSGAKKKASKSRKEPNQSSRRR